MLLNVNLLKIHKCDILNIEQPYQKQCIKKQKIPVVSKVKYSLMTINFYVSKVTI